MSRTPAPTCAGVTPKGEPCQKTPMKGGTHCYYHSEADRANQCGAPTATGIPCRMPRMKGASTCLTHGGMTHLSRNKAKLTLLAMCEPAFEALLVAMQFADYQTSVKAAQVVLDRAGFGPHSSVTVDDQTSKHDMDDMSLEELGKRTEAIYLAIKQKRAEAEMTPVDAPSEDVPPSESSVH